MAYLEDGTLDLLSIQYRLQNGFIVKRKKLVPEAYILRVDEPEKNSIGQVIFAKTHGLTLKGQKVWLFSEEDLEISGIYDDTWVCRVEQDHQLVCWREGTDELLPVPEDLWKNKLEEK